MGAPPGQGKSCQIQVVKTVPKRGLELEVINASPRGKRQLWSWEKSPCDDESQQICQAWVGGGPGDSLQDV